MANPKKKRVIAILTSVNPQQRDSPAGGLYAHLQQSPGAGMGECSLGAGLAG
jgi:hypothetical protein